MTDKEMLELAAKAAELDFIPSIDGGFGVINGVTHKPWNPLKDDGDALRLAILLGINVPTKWEHEHMKNCGLDVYQITRKVIVYEAAMIGKEGDK